VVGRAFNLQKLSVVMLVVVIWLELCTF